MNLRVLQNIDGSDRGLRVTILLELVSITQLGRREKRCRVSALLATTRVGYEVLAEILQHMLDVPVRLDEQKFLTNMRKSRRRAAAGF